MCIYAERGGKGFSFHGASFIFGGLRLSNSEKENLALDLFKPDADGASERYETSRLRSTRQRRASIRAARCPSTLKIVCWCIARDRVRKRSLTGPLKPF